MAQKLTTKQRALFALLKSRANGIVTDDEILSATGWKADSWKVYCTNSLYAQYLHEDAPGRYRVRIDPNTTEGEFRLAATQAKRQAAFKHPLAQALLSRSRDNMVLALEVYNRPSLVNRLDAFSMLFITAWEQLLKAELVERDGEPSIFRSKRAGQRRESIGLDECLARVFPAKDDPTRRNVECVAELRHGATHLVMPELQGAYARVFQAGVFGFARRLLEQTGATLIARHNIGLLALAASEESLDAVPLARLYGDVLACELVEQGKTIEDEATRLNDHRFAVPLEYTLRFATAGEQADVTLVRAAEAPTTAVVFEKPVDPERTHPLRTTQLVKEIASHLERPFGAHDLQAVLFKTAWKKSDNEYHRLQRNPDTPKFSRKAVETIVRSIEDDAEYLARARESYAHHRGKLRKKG